MVYHLTGMRNLLQRMGKCHYKMLCISLLTPTSLLFLCQVGSRICLSKSLSIFEFGCVCISNNSPHRFKDSLTGYKTMMDFMRLQIAERQEHVRNRSKEELGKDAFTMLVSANAAEDPKLRLSDEELVIGFHKPVSCIQI